MEIYNMLSLPTRHIRQLGQWDTLNYEALRTPPASVLQVQGSVVKLAIINRPVGNIWVEFQNKHCETVD